MKVKICAVFLLALLWTYARAGSILELPIHRGGRVSHGTKGGHEFVDGSGIGITELIDGNLRLPVVMGDLSFDIERSVGSSSNDWIFGPGGQFIVTGCVELTGACNQNQMAGTLLTGTFLSAKVLQDGGETILIAKFLEQLNPELAALLKVSDSPSEGELRLVLVGAGTKGRWVLGGELTSIPTIPEPATILVLAPGMVGLGIILLYPRMKTGLAWKICRRP